MAEAEAAAEEDLGAMEEAFVEDATLEAETAALVAEVAGVRVTGATTAAVVSAEGKRKREGGLATTLRGERFGRARFSARPLADEEEVKGTDQRRWYPQLMVETVIRERQTKSATTNAAERVLFRTVPLPPSLKQGWKICSLTSSRSSSSTGGVGGSGGGLGS